MSSTPRPLPDRVRLVTAARALVDELNADVDDGCCAAVLEDAFPELADPYAVLEEPRTRDGAPAESFADIVSATLRLGAASVRIACDADGFMYVVE